MSQAASIPFVGDLRDVKVRRAVFLLFLIIVIAAALRRVAQHAASLHVLSVGAAQAACFVLILCACIAAISARRMRYSEWSPPLRITARGVGAAFLVQAVCDAVGPFAQPPNLMFGDGRYETFFLYGTALALISGVAAMWRPSFLIPLFLYYASWRAFLARISGIEIAPTDYLGTLDLGLFLAIGGLTTWALTTHELGARWLKYCRWLFGAEPGPDVRSTVQNLVWACGVGAHLGSYFWSAVAKIGVGGDEPLTWIFHNPTQLSIVIGLERGDNPLAQWPHLLQALWDGMASTAPFLNAFVLGLQLLAPLAALSPWLLAAFCLLYDMFHGGVYLTLGALFHFWIIANLFIAKAATTLRVSGFTFDMKITMVLSVFLAQFAFNTNYLGWLDGGKLAMPHIYAHTRDGRDVAVPGNYFGIFSYPIGHPSVFIPRGHFPVLIGGGADNREAWEDALSCGDMIGQEDTGSFEPVRDLVRRTDRLMRTNPRLKSDNLYYFYPHHLPSNPLAYTEFNRLKINDIIGYDYVVDSVCLSLENGQLVRDVRKSSRIPINIR